MLMARALALGGTERQMTEIAKALDRSRFEPHVGCFHQEGFRAEELRGAGIPIVKFPVHSFRSASVLAAACQMGRYLKRYQIQLVHTFDVPMNLFGVPAARAFGVPLVVSSQRAYRSLTPGLMHHLLRVTDLMVNAVVVNSRTLQNHLIEEEKLPPRLIQLCYNGIDTRVFHPSPARRPSVLCGASLVIGVVSALRPEKGLRTLLEAFAEVGQVHCRLKLVIVGSGPALADLESHCRRLGLAADCHFEPATRNVAEWLRAIDIFVLPSLSEALSNSLMEAMACGCCVAASRVGGNPELVAHERTGLLFRPGDPADLARCLRLLIDQGSLREKLAAAGRRFICENFSLEVSARRMAEIYSGLLQESTDFH